MSLFISLLFLLPAHASKPSCAWSLESMADEDVRLVLMKTRITPTKVISAYAELKLAFENMSVWPPDQLDSGSQLTNDFYKTFAIIVFQIVMGNDAVAVEINSILARDLSARLQRSMDENLLFGELSKIAKRFEVPVTLAQFLTHDFIEPEALLYKIMRKYKELGLGPSGAGPMQLELIKVALQYGGSRGDVKLLHFDANPASLLSLAYYTGKPVVGVTSYRTSVEHTAFLGERGVTLIRGEFPNADLIGRLQTQGPFQVVVAQDILTKDAFSKLIAPGDLVRAIRQLMRPSGILVIVNDRQAEPTFTREEAIAAGFEIVRWQSPRPLASEWMAHLPLNLRTPTTGSLWAFVFRAGDLDIEQARSDLFIQQEGSFRRIQASDYAHKGSEPN